MARAAAPQVPLCQICGQSRRNHPSCALCDGDDNIERLCAPCRRDPANRDWVLAGREDLGDLDDIASDARTRPRRSLAEALAHLARRASPKVQKILRLASEPVIQRVVRRDRRNRLRGTYTRRRWRSASEIAKAVGCTPTYVVLVRQRYYKLLVHGE